VYITISQKTWRGLATEDGYQKGLKYNESIKAVKKQKELGWNLRIEYQPSHSREGFLQIDLFDKNNQNIRNADLISNFRRPAQEGNDFSLPLKFNSETYQYGSKVEFPLIGQWDIEIVAKKGSDVFQDVKRIVIQ
jgi:nitrogen fixation protein FixH